MFLPRKAKYLTIFLCFVCGCHVADIPIIGWRIDVARQRKAYIKQYRERHGEDPKNEQQRMLEEYLGRAKNPSQ